MWALKVDINLLNQHCKPADWLAGWLTDWLKHLCNQITQGTRALKVLKALEGQISTLALRTLGHSGTQRALGPLVTQGTRAFGHFRHSDTQRALEHSTLKGLGHSGARRTLGHLSTQALEHLGTRDTQDTLFSKLLQLIGDWVLVFFVYDYVYVFSLVFYLHIFLLRMLIVRT